MSTDRSREERALTALNDMLPAEFTWVERCDPPWRAAFPCGIAPLFVYRTTITVCTAQMADAGTSLADGAFEDLLDALIDWVFVSAVPYQFNESVDHVLAVLRDMQPDHAVVLEAAARLNNMSLARFLGADRRDAT